MCLRVVRVMPGADYRTRNPCSATTSCKRSPSPEGTRFWAAKSGVVERVEAEAIVDGDRETAVLLLMRVGELVEANRRLETRVAQLEQRLNRSSRNSSLPPSQDPPSAPPRRRGPSSGREPGGQPGHQGKSRPLLPLERVDEIVDHWPQRCRACAHVFGEAERIDAAAPQRHQVIELPQIAVTVSEHRLHRARCPRLCRRDAGTASGGGAAWRLRAPAAGRGRGARRSQPRLPPRRSRARA